MYLAHPSLGQCVYPPTHLPWGSVCTHPHTFPGAVYVPTHTPSLGQCVYLAHPSLGQCVYPPTHLPGVYLAHPSLGQCGHVHVSMAVLSPLISIWL